MRALLLSILAGLAGFGLARWVSAPPIPERIASATMPASNAQPADATPPPAATVPVDAVKSPRERLTAAIHTKDLIASASHLLLVIDAMTADDFRQLASDSSRATMPWAYGQDQEFQHAFTDALVERWFAVDPAGALPGIQQIEKKLIIGPGSRWAGSGGLLAALARVRPAVLLDTLPANGTWDRSDPDIPAAFTALAKRDAPAARSYLARIDDADRRHFAEIAIAQGVAENDPLAAAALARTLNSDAVFQTALQSAERMGAGALRDVLVANARQFPIGFGFAALVLRHPDEDWPALANDPKSVSGGITDEVQNEAKNIPADERERLLARSDQLPDGVRDTVTSALIAAWSQEDPRAALDWACAHTGDPTARPPGDSPLSWAFHSWMREDQNALLAWWKQLPASPLQKRLGDDIVSTLANTGQLDEALALYRPQPGAQSANVTASLALAKAQADPAAAAAWIDSLPRDVDTASAVRSLVTQWVTRDAGAAANWAEAQPAGAPRDAALQAYSQAAAELDPGAAAEWTATISDPLARAQAAESVFREMNKHDPAGARSWLSGLPGVDETWRDRFLRLHR